MALNGNNGTWAKVMQATLIGLAGAACLALIVIEQNIGELLRNQTHAMDQLTGFIDQAEVRSMKRHNELIQTCLTMEQRMCDRLCKERRE